ncbi:penicillin-binding protein 1C [Aureispira anguillae]|uniref:peptidoglycan glycosyltransferase n=1 Tax=Aureispira anguillae TaxID=2864201 RepID=A0A916DVG5_9BACT|nr:penicillin-binding protein 1C [Aureispira anguillae]BDS13707.1 penicillin-binding protein 1C [Aureispira anguillae]
MKGIKQHKRKLLGGGIILLIGYYFCLPATLFLNPTSTVLFDKNGALLGAKIARDGQWRFPHNDSVPYKFKKAIIAFEDKRFEQHWGIDIWAILRAIRLNTQQGRRVSGGSTLTMQTLRMARNNPDRTVVEKIKEALLATRLEWSYSKSDILGLYASNAPFGGNVVGLDAAAWKYFGRSAQQLSWAESCMLAVLPNSPSLIHLGRNRKKLKKKRDWLLDKLYNNGEMDSLTCSLAKLENLPQKPKPLPRLSPHLLERVHKELVLSGNSNGIIHSTIDLSVQTQINAILNRHYQVLKSNEIYNAAALVIEVETGDVVAYTGNVPQASVEHSPAVDIITAPRSSGSILKPFLYAAMLHDGEMTSSTLFPDIPSHFGGYTPMNYDESYSGAVKANRVITKSLNIPSVYMLKRYGMMRFADKLRRLGMTTLKYSAKHYGLTLILGGAEASLWDLGAMYSGMARNLNNVYAYNGWYDPNNFRKLNYLNANSKGRLTMEEQNVLQKSTPLSAAAIWHTFEAMQEVVRPNEDVFWKSFPSADRVAWKTGTSFGFRDAWAVGCTPEYVVAIWVGNADGEGRPGLVGVHAAAPILFDAFRILNTDKTWFEQPYDELLELSICKQSGHIASEYCTDVVKRYEPKSSSKSKVCPYHKRIHLSKDQFHQVHSDCEWPMNMVSANYFVLPPAQSWYYQKKHPSYKIVPSYRSDCKTSLENRQKKRMALIYPEANMKIYVPTNLDETKSRTVFEAKHSDVHAQLFWHLDNSYIGQTQELHYMELNPTPGKHTITIVDEDGESIRREFVIIAGEEK